MKTVAIVGCGNLGSIIGREICARLKEYYTLTAVFDVNEDAAGLLAADTGAAHAGSLDELLASKPDYVVEATAPAVLKNMAEKVLEAGSDLIALSVGAFADDGFMASVTETAKRLQRRVHIASGAIGGFDLMQAAVARGGDLKTTVTNIKNPRSLEGAPFLSGRTLSRSEKETVFSGNARDAIEAFPKNVNVAVAAAIATVGAQNTSVTVISDPEKTLNTHRIDLEGTFGRATLEICSAPSKNPKSSELAAYSVIAKLKNLAAPVSFC